MNPYASCACPTPPAAPLTLVIGDTGVFPATILAPPDFTAPQNLAGCEVAFVGYATPADPSCERPVPVITLTTTGGGVVVDSASAGTVTATIPPAMTEYLAPQTLAFRWVLTDAAGNITTVQQVDVVLTN